MRDNIIGGRLCAGARGRLFACAVVAIGFCLSPAAMADPGKDGAGKDDQSDKKSHRQPDLQHGRRGKGERNNGKKDDGKPVVTPRDPNRHLHDAPKAQDAAQQTMYPQRTGKQHAGSSRIPLKKRAGTTRSGYMAPKREVYAPMPDLTYPAFGWGYGGYGYGYGYGYPNRRGWNYGYGYGEPYRNNRGYRRYPWSYGYIGWPVYTYGQYPVTDPRLTMTYPQAVEVEVEEVDPTLDALENGRYEEAVSLLGAEIEADTDNQESRRLMVVALVGAGSPDIAAEALFEILLADPSSAAQPLDGPTAVGGETEFRRLLMIAVTHANRNPSPEAWLLVTSMMQAESRLKVAARQLDKAEKLGLIPQVLAPMRDALEGRAALP